MYKCVCDVCRSNEANQHFKVKKLCKVFRFPREVSEWVKLDICDQCYEKFIGIIHEKEDREKMMETMKVFVGKPCKENKDE